MSYTQTGAHFFLNVSTLKFICWTSAEVCICGILEDLDENGETKNTLSFKGTGLKT